jgi:hypothetical protein
LSLVGTPNLSIDFLEQLGEHLVFECVLKYVELPVLIFKTVKLAKDGLLEFVYSR